MDNLGYFHKCRILLDSGSQYNLITRAFSKKLGLKTGFTNHKLTFVNQSESKVTEMTSVSLKTRLSDYTANINCLILETITEPLPLNSFSAQQLSIPNTLNLADPTFNISGPIDLLIGSELFLDILTAGKILLKPLLYLHNTTLGWILSGPLSVGFSKEFPASNNTSCNNNTVTINSDLENLSKQVAKFWETEDYHTNKPVPVQQDIICESHFKANTKRDANGRFWVSLPIKDNCKQLGSSSEMARKRFLSLEKKLNKDPNLK
ncbi:uncharacterized protein LOC135143931 [Zophobas morio]|uniref:uncharacterized protein LOC135143931 n=1 Tax=Zophobas morio TaxID=2755281 RepID=UPI0030836197